MKIVRPANIIQLGLCFLFATGAGPLTAQTLTTLKTDSNRVAVGTPVTAFVEFTPAERNWCGFFIDWGDGKEHQSFRIGKPPDLSSPVNRKRTFDRPGSYTIRAYGEFVSKGLNSASACSGAPKPVVISVFDPVAEEQQRRAEAKRRAEEAELERAKDAAERAKADAERARVEAERQKKALELQEMELKRKELELREQAIRRAEQEKKSAVPPAPRPPVQQTPPSKPATPPPVKPADGF